VPDLAALTWPAILTGTVVGGALGALWYSPALFGSAWMAELGKNAEELAPDGRAMAGSIFSCLVAATTVEWLATAIGADGAAAGAGLGLLLGLGIVAMTMLSDALFSGWTARLYTIQLGYRASYLLLMGTISGTWPA
jgi:hypothetical protein